MPNSIKLDSNLILFFDYGGYRIAIYPSKIKGKAIEFRLFDVKKALSSITMWIPKQIIEKRDGRELYGVSWLCDKAENREKLEKLGYKV